jgi:N-methylhydantoinase B
MPSVARKKPAPRPSSARSGRSVDPVTSEIILGAFETICYEMATHVSLTATTPI